MRVAVLLLCLLLAMAVAVAGFEPIRRPAAGKARATAPAEAQDASSVAGAADAGEAARRTDVLVLQHSLDGGLSFSDRSTVTLSFGAAAGRAGASGRSAVGGSSSVGTANFEENQAALSLEQKRQLVELAIQGGFYSVRLVDGGEVVAQSFAPACHVLQSRLREQFTFHVDPLGNVVGLGYTTPSGSTAELACDRAEAEALLQDGAAALKEGFRPKGRFGLGATGQAPKQVRATGPTAVNGEPAKKGEDAQSEPGFLQKYWMYILIGVVVLVIQTVVAPPPAEGQQAAPQAGRPAAASK